MEFAMFDCDVPESPARRSTTFDCGCPTAYAAMAHGYPFAVSFCSTFRAYGIVSRSKLAVLDLDRFAPVKVEAIVVHVYVAVYGYTVYENLFAVYEVATPRCAVFQGD